MRANYEVVKIPANRSLRCWYLHGCPPTNVPWHSHPEIELVYIESSRGLRFIGDSVRPYSEGDLVLIGSDLPHSYIDTSAHAFEVRNAGVQFRPDFLGAGLWAVPEFSSVAKLLQRSRQGIHFSGPATAEIGRRLIHMRQTEDGIERIGQLLVVLNLLARFPGQTLLSSAGYLPELNSSDAVRINTVCRYVLENLTDTISQPAAAALVHMSSAGFSHFFRKKMGRTFSAYVNQLRIARVVHLLLEEKLTIAEVCFASGFNNISNFNRQFKAINGVPPSEVLRRLRGTSAAIK